MDSQIRAGLNKILNTELKNTQWVQASLPIRDGGLGTRRLSMLATSAYLAPAASTVLLVRTILGAEEWTDTYKYEMLESRKDSLPTVMDA